MARPRIRGAALSNHTSFRVAADGSLTFISKLDIEDGQKTTQVLVSRRDRSVVFGNDFQVDVNLDGDGPVPRLWSPEPPVRGQLQALRLNAGGAWSGSTACRSPSRPRASGGSGTAESAASEKTPPASR